MSREKTTVCIVEDDLAVRSALVALIECGGYAARAFASAEEFLQCNDELPCDFLIVDIGLPGISGIELLDQLAESGLSRPTVVITGHADSEDVIRLTLQKEIQFLKKPWDPEALLAIIANSCQGHGNNKA